MRRYLILAFLLLLSLPFDASLTGCFRNPAANFCNNTGFGLSNTAVAAIDLEPKVYGISLSYAQIGQLQSPTATNCTGGKVSVTTFNYGTSDMTLADVSPTGAICAGTWNRTTGSGIAPFTTCLPTNKTGVAYMTASVGGVTSNTVPVFIHPQITNISLDVTNNQNGQTNQPTQTQNGCYSQGQTAQLNATAYVEGQSSPFCEPNSGNPNIPDCNVNLGHLTYTPVTSGIVTIDQNGVATAQLPGSTVVTSTVAGVSSNAGYFYTCPPKSIKLTANGGNTLNVTPNTPIALSASILDTNNNPITGLNLAYTSTSPQTIGVSSTGTVTSQFPSTSAVYAVCQPPSCNPSPINQIGVNGNGTPVVSDAVTVTSPGNTSTYLWLASPLSPYFIAVDLTTGTTGTPVRLPFTPNSMVMDQPGNFLYFGSYRELMVFNTSNGALTEQNTAVPGVVLAVSPDGSTAVINDQDRQVIYLYNTTSNSILSTFGGVAQRAVFSPDSTTVYLAGDNQLYVHNSFTGWSVEPLTNNTAGSTACTPIPNAPDANTAYNVFCSPDLGLAVPAVGAFISGTTVTSRGFCPDTTGTTVDNYPNAGNFTFAADHLAAVNNGAHVLGATANPPLLTDQAITTPNGECPTQSATQPGTTTTVNKTVGLTFGNNGITQFPLTGYGIQSIDQVVASPDSSLAFVTYTTNATTPPSGGALLPVYKLPGASGGSGTLTSVPLAGGATAPIAGIFSPDYQTFFVSTSGDNLIHLIATPTLKDTSQFNPKLPDVNGNPTPAQFMAVKPRPTV